MRKTLDPKLDVVFKLLFADERNRKLLCSLLTAVLEPEQPIADLVVLNPETPKETVHDKGAILDVRAQLRDGRHTNVEMQGFPHPGLAQRVLFYWARTFSAQIYPGESHDKLNPTVGVFILNFRKLRTKRFHTTFRVRYIHESTELSDDLTLHFLELPKLPEDPLRPDEPGSQKWGRFFRAKTDEELEQLAMHDPQLREAKNALDRLSEDPAAKELASEREKAAWNYEHTLRSARHEGKAEGRVEGKAEGRVEGETKLLLRTLERRSVPISDSQRERILGCTDVDQLERWFDRALTASSADELFE